MASYGICFSRSIALIRAEIGEVVRLQEDLGVDVLVHGEPERNDMVQYFAERLDAAFFFGKC